MNSVLPVFIASPSGLVEERNSAEKAIQQLSPRFMRLFGIGLVPMRWEDFAPVSSHDRTHPQYALLRDIQPFSVFIGMFADKPGTPVGDSNETGTETEFLFAIKNITTISILSYFKKQTVVSGQQQTEEQKRIEDFEKKLHEKNLLTISYENLSQFECRIMADIMEACLGQILTGEPKRKLDYYNIFKFGSHWRTASRPLLIVYPPMSDPGPGHPRPKLEWRKRLLPHVIYEDFKAIQDVEEAMRLIGRVYKTVTTDSPTLSSADRGDRIWVCLPRNRKAQHVLKDVLKAYGSEKIRFEFRLFTLEDGTNEHHLIWNKNSWQNKKEIKIRSPLSKYLTIERRI